MLNFVDFTQTIQLPGLKPVSQPEPEPVAPAKPSLAEFLASKMGQISGTIVNGAKQAGQTIENLMLPPRTKAQNILANVTPQTPANPQKPQINIDNVLNSIAQIESGGVKDPYSFHKVAGKTMGQDLGKYQVTSGELKSYSKQFLGKQVSDNEFLNNSNLQDQYMRGKVQQLVNDGIQLPGIFALHAQGLTHYGDPKVVEQKIKDANQNRGEYVDKGVALYNQNE